jgi:hypothetical protein
VPLIYDCHSFCGDQVPLPGSLNLSVMRSAVGMSVSHSDVYSSSRDSSDGLVTRLWAGPPRNRSLILARDKKFIPKNTGSWAYKVTCLVARRPLTAGREAADSEADL